MHVKRQLVRLFGSLRRKESKGKSPGKVLDQPLQLQLQTKAKASSSSRWELLDCDQEEQDPEFKELAQTGNPFPLAPLPLPLPLSSPDEQIVEVTLHKSPSKRWKKPKNYEELATIETLRINAELELTTTIVQQINETISLINEFPANNISTKGDERGDLVLRSNEYKSKTESGIDLDTIVRVEGVSRLTRELEEEEAINLAWNEDSRDDYYPSWTKNAETAESGKRGSWNTWKGSYERGSRPGADVRKIPRGGSLRTSGRRLYSRIQNTFRKKELEEHLPPGQDPYGENADDDGPQSPRSPTTPKARENKSISSPDEKASPGLPLKRRGKWSASFRKVIPTFPRPSAFQPLQTNNQVQNQAQENDDEVNGPGNTEQKLKRKSSLRASFRDPGKGVKKVLMKGVRGFGKSMIHASAVMPMQYESPMNSNYNYTESNYWMDDEDMYDFRRRYANYYDPGLDRSTKREFYQHGYCYNG